MEKDTLKGCMMEIPSTFFSWTLPNLLGKIENRIPLQHAVAEYTEM